MLYDGDTFERGGRTFKVEFPYDDFGRVPWEDCDGHGPVSDWTSRDKKPGERVLHSDRSSKRFYDWQEAIAIAKRDGWGLCDKDKEKLASKLRKPVDELTRGEIVEEAVRRDFEYLRAWCNDEWTYIGVVVKLLDEDGEETEHSDSLWGIESDAYDYLQEVAEECADQILAIVAEETDARQTDEARAWEESRPDLYGL